jgi:hypothetical protein
MEIVKKEITINLDDFCYDNKQHHDILNWDCLDYSFDYRSKILKKFPPGYENIPGFNEIIDKLVEDAKMVTPLEEMEKRIREAKELEQYLEYEEEKEPDLFSRDIYNGNNTNLSKFKNC